MIQNQDVIEKWLIALIKFLKMCYMESHHKKKQKEKWQIGNKNVCDTYPKERTKINNI